MYKSKEILKLEALNIIEEYTHDVRRARAPMLDVFAKRLLEKLEPIIFDYAPLPISIQEALNSGDGVYRP